ncbi:MFS transporter [Desulfofundulus thermobenzoicus]|uniref:MFS transporter n=1 Tax=Desulfofundulus thermobenzoicus TaxID=29376 RepID=A0A6N7ITW8_9FIRM|nr:MFS transporter [Desulfofundulus thermobenzoicus]MQL53575.1 MFS transporter [Desulfofundulus thermobenzoicus]
MGIDTSTGQFSPQKFESESERITPYQWKVLSAVVFAYLFDGLDSMLFSLTLAMIMKEFAIGKDIAGLIATIFIGGQITGGMFVGLLGDLLGRKGSLIFAIFVYSIGTLLCAIAPSWGWLALFRAVTGFGAVGAQAPMASLIAETWPARHRSKCASMMMCMWGIAACIGALIVWLFVPRWGWRSVYLIGGLSGLLMAIPYVYFTIKETARFQDVAEKRRKAKEEGRGVLSDIADFLRVPKWRRNWLIGLAAPMAQLTTLWAFLTLVPAYVMVEKGYSVSKGMTWFLVTNIVGTFGFLLWGPFADWKGRRSAFAAWALIAAVCMPLSLLWAPNLAWFWILSSMTIFGIYGTYSGIMTYLPELFPTKMRSTAVGVTNQSGRLLSAFAPWLVGMLSMKIGTGLAVSLTAVVWIFVLWAAAVGPETKGKSLEELTGEES